MSQFVGAIDQVPPGYSAAKVAGHRAYDLARRGNKVDLQPRRVRIDSIDLLSYAYPRLEVEVRCGKGAYIRSLARDLGERLGCGGLIATLRRTRVGLFTEEEAISLDTEAQTARASILPLSAAVPYLARATLDEARLARLRCGLAVPADLTVGAEDDNVAVMNERGDLIAVARFDRESGLIRPKNVIAI